MNEQQEKLIASYFDGQISESEKAELLSYLETDREFAALFGEYEKAYAAACVPAFEKFKESDYQKIMDRIGMKTRKGVSRGFFAAVAGIAASILIGCVLYLRSTPDMNDMTILAQNGTGTEAVLPDGTHVRLNAESALTVCGGFMGKERLVSLKGEAYFEVAHDSRHPFKVQAGNTCVTVKGTTFNVRNYEDEPEVSVSLFEGSVVLNTPSSEAVLVPGQRAIVCANDNSIKVSKTDQSVSSWVKGKYMFEDKTIPEILHDVERNYGVSFVYDKGLFGPEHFTGTLSYNLSIDEILTYLDVDKVYAWSRHDNTVEIYGK